MVAFARNPMTVALQANDVQALSGGRFTLGLGSQIKPHITRRYSMPWSKPAARMREFILAIRAIWDTWGTGAPLEFEGDFYTHTLMAPFFDPGPNPHGNPKIMLAAVGPLMTETAGEVADGVLVHGFSTERYLREATLPALERGFAKAGRTREGFEITAPGVRGRRATPRRRSPPGSRRSSSRSPSTARPPPTGRCSSCTAGASSRTSCKAMTKRGEWDRMSELIADELVETFAVVGTPGGGGRRDQAPLRRHRDPDHPAAAAPSATSERWRGLFDSLRA